MIRTLQKEEATVSAIIIRDAVGHAGSTKTKKTDICGTSAAFKERMH